MSEQVSTANATQQEDALSVEVCSNQQQWDQFARAACQTPLFLLAGWDTVFREYRLNATRLVVRSQQKIVCGLPLVTQKSLLLGRQIVSLPWFDDAGILTLTEFDEASDRLFRRALTELTNQRCRQLELRCNQPQHPAAAPRTDKVMMHLSLPANPEQLWSGFKATVRNQVRKAEKSQLQAMIGGAELLDEFYRIYSINMRDLGSPCHSRKFFQAVIDAFTPETQICVIRLDGLAVGAGWTMANGSRLEIPWASSLRKFNSLCVNHLMYWTILKNACQRGFDCFNFGRSSVDSGTYRFKKQWGAVPVPLYWYCFDQQGRSIQQQPAKESFGWASKIWQRLPLKVSQLIGPVVISRVS